MHDSHSIPKIDAAHSRFVHTEQCIAGGYSTTPIYVHNQICKLLKVDLAINNSLIFGCYIDDGEMYDFGRHIIDRNSTKEEKNEIA
jgi:hypothetical protein